MPIATPTQYRQMLNNAKQNKYAYPAINITSMETARATLQGLAEAKSDGIIQVSTGGGQYASGLMLKDMPIGAIALAEYVHLMSNHFNILVALHTDHCHFDKLDTFLRPLIQEAHRRRELGLPLLFQSHMFDGSTLPLSENLRISRELAQELKTLDILLEVEAGVVGGEEDGHDTSNTPNEKLYTTSEDMIAVYEALADIDENFLFAATFGNVHGVYKPGNVKLNPSILRDGQKAVSQKYPNTKMNLVFHGGSGSSLKEIHETLDYGVVKMNIDTDMQYAYTRPIADHMMKHYDGVLKIDQEVGDKKYYDPRYYGKLAERAMADRVIKACEDLKSINKTLYI